MGFIRNTLRGRDPGSNRFKCDLVIGVPVGFELASTTKPYYRSTYALVYVKGKGLDGVTAPEGLLGLEPAKLKSLKLGVIGQTPPADWLLRHRLFDQVVPYQLQSGDPERYPGEIVEKDLVAGKVDVAFVWGPIAGYFAKNATSAALAVVPFEPTPGIQFDFRIAIAFACLAWSFVTNDFSVANVASNSNSRLPVPYRFAATWGSHEGSMLLRVLMLAAWTVAVTLFSRHLPEETVARVLGVMAIVSCGFLVFTLLTSNPFELVFPPPPDGRDLNPLLQDPGMV